MKRATLPALFCMLLFLLAPAAQAQKWELRIAPGPLSSALEERLDVVLSGALRYRLSDDWSLEGEYVRDLGPGNNAFYWVNLIRNRVSCVERCELFTLGGIGMQRNGRWANRASQGPTVPAVSFGFGVRSYLTDRIFIAPRARIALSNDVTAETSLGVGWSF